MFISKEELEVLMLVYKDVEEKSTISEDEKLIFKNFAKKIAKYVKKEKERKRIYAKNRRVREKEIENFGI